MPVKTDNIRRWIEQSDIDYFTQFIKAWIPFNAWYNAEYNDLESDRAIINSIKTKRNSIRNKINSLLEGTGQESEEFKSYLASLHSELTNNHIDSRDGRIWFRDIVKYKNSENLIDNETNNTIDYYLHREDGKRLGEVKKMKVVIKSRSKRLLYYEHSEYSLHHLQQHREFITLSPTQQTNARMYFDSLGPIVVSDMIQHSLQSSPQNFYKCDSFYLVRDPADAYCQGHIICHGLIEILYQLRNVLFHGELPPLKQYQLVYKNAYFCLKYLLTSIQ